MDMMSPNGTFVVQLAHFLITWFLLDRFLFRKVYAAVVQDERKHARLEKTFEQWQTHKLSLQTKQAEQIATFKKDAHARTPLVIVPADVSTIAVLCPVVHRLSVEETRGLIEETEALCMKRIMS